MKTLTGKVLVTAISMLGCAALITPAAAGYSFPPEAAEFHANPGSRPSPAPDDLRGMRYYPAGSRMNAEEGVVGVKIMLTEEGRTGDALIENSSGFSRLDEAALRYAREQYQYKPAPGEPMPEVARIMVKFDLD